VAVAKMAEGAGDKRGDGETTTTIAAMRNDAVLADVLMWVCVAIGGFGVFLAVQDAWT